MLSTCGYHQASASSHLQDKIDCHGTRSYIAVHKHHDLHGFKKGDCPNSVRWCPHSWCIFLNFHFTCYLFWKYASFRLPTWIQLWLQKAVCVKFNQLWLGIMCQCSPMPHDIIVNNVVLLNAGFLPYIINQKFGETAIYVWNVYQILKELPHVRSPHQAQLFIKSRIIVKSHA